MAKYQAYPEYKNSGVEWIGNIPKHWKLSRIKYVADCLDGARIPLNSQERAQKQGDVPYWGANKIVDYINDYLFDEELVLLGEDGAPFFDPLKDVAFNVNGKVWPNNHVHVLRPDKTVIDVRFLKYALNCADFHLYISGSTRDKLNQSDMNEIYIRLASLDEISSIANFLDHETAKIDTLIEKQQQLIALLKEKRQAVISHAVTKGLNPDAPMRDSGVEWLGDVPEHWNVAAIRRYLVEHRQGYYTTDAYVDDGTKLLRITDLRSLGEISINDCPNVPYSDTLKNYLLEEGDVVFARTGGAGSFGVIPSLKEEVAYASYLIRFRFLPKHFNTNYLRFMLVADSFQLAVKSNIHGGVTQNIHAEDIKDTFVASPPLEEQKEISLYLDKQSDKYAELINQADLAIQLMQERRTALISAAVTGKIDVRNWVAPEKTKTKDVA